MGNFTDKQLDSIILNNGHLDTGYNLVEVGPKAVLLLAQDLKSTRDAIRSTLERSQELLHGHRLDLETVYADCDDDDPIRLHKESMVTFHRGEVYALEELLEKLK